MSINHYIRFISIAVVLLMATQMSAQEHHCKDTAEHRRLVQTMWESCKQDSQDVVYDACLAFRTHALADDNILEASTSWVCGIMYSLGKMNISSAYHIVQGLRGDIENSRYAEEGQYFISNMMGHVYNTCGNIHGAEAEFLKSAEQIKGTQFENDGLAFIYLALAHVHLNNSLTQTLYWLDVTEKVLEKNRNSWNYNRCLSDVYAIKAIVRFKQKDYNAFQKCLEEMEEVESSNHAASGDLFTPYARIYRTRRKVIENMPVVDTEKIQVKLDDQTNGDTMLFTNSDSLLLMLSYILENSVKFTEKGHIILKVRTEMQKGRKMMLFSVEDTGCGIPSDKQGTIFQRWMKADEFKEGLGLGLAYCLETAQKLGGELKLDQTSEAGTTFTLRLPVENQRINNNKN